MRTTFQVELSAYRGDEDESWRLGRLEDWMSWYAFKIGNPMHCVHSSIHSVHDHKGCFTITFSQKPTQPMMDCATWAYSELGEVEEIQFQYVETVVNIVKVEANDGDSI